MNTWAVASALPAPSLYPPILPLLGWYNWVWDCGENWTGNPGDLFPHQAIFLLTWVDSLSWLTTWPCKQLHHSSRGCRDVNWCEAGWHQQGRLCIELLLQWPDNYPRVCFILFPVIAERLYRFFFLLNGHSSTQICRIINLFECFHKVTPQHWSGAPQWMPSVS